MARKRMIDPTIWADAAFASLSSEARVLYIGIISNADDEGRLPGNALFLTATIFPYDGYSKEKAVKMRNEILSKMKSLVLYKIDGEEYLQFLKWNNYQSINKASQSKYPPLPEDYGSTTVALPPNRIEENRIEEKKNVKNSSVEQSLKEYLQEFNTVFRTAYSATEPLRTNYVHWLKSYTHEQILEAVRNSRNHDFWGDKMKPVILLRRSDANKNSVDYIGEMLNYKKKTAFSGFTLAK